MDVASSILQQYDEIIRCTNVLIDGVNLDETFLCFLKKQQSFIDKYIETTDECRRLKVKLDGADKDISVLENKLASARRWLDAERQLRKRVEEECEAFSQHLDEARRILLNDPHYKLNDETKQKLLFLNKFVSDDRNGWGPFNDRLNTIAENDSLSDMSFSRSADDLDDALPVVSNNKYRPSFPDDKLILTKRRKSSEVSKPKNVTSQPYEKNAVAKINARTHSFVTKTYIMPESCSWCSKKVGFGKMVYKCFDCQTIAHPECYEKVPLPCIPMGTSPKKSGAGYISDYAPAAPPMIPALVVHCINEVERRGLHELGIYRISGMESVIRGLRDKFAKNKGVPCISDIDIHSVCCFLKDFLRNLQDPLIPRNKWQAFSEAINKDDKDEKLHHVIVSLPQANRDTLAFIIVHLRNVASSPECRMPISSLAPIFGPTIVGYSNAEPMNALTEARTANAIMEALLLLPPDYWNNFIDPVSEPKTNYLSIATTGAYTPARKTRRLMRTPGSKRKYFNSSPPSQ